MQNINTFRKFNEVIRVGEEKIKNFHQTKDQVDSYKRVIHAIFDKRVYQKCVDELKMAHDELSAFERHLKTFYTKNKRFFNGLMKQYLDSYMKYISAAVTASEKRLILQQLILDIKVNKTMKEYRMEIPSMMKDVNKSYEKCLSYVVSFNRIADEIKAALASGDSINEH